MRTAGELRYYTETEALALSRLDHAAVLSCIEAGIVKPAVTDGGLEFSQSDVLILKLIYSIVHGKRALRATKRLSRHFGAAQATTPRQLGGQERTSAIARLVELLMQKEE